MLDVIDLRQKLDGTHSLQLHLVPSDLNEFTYTLEIYIYKYLFFIER